MCLCRFLGEENSSTAWTVQHRVTRSFTSHGQKQNHHGTAAFTGEGRGVHTAVPMGSKELRCDNLRLILQNLEWLKLLRNRSLISTLTRPSIIYLLSYYYKTFSRGKQINKRNNMLEMFTRWNNMAVLLIFWICLKIRKLAFRLNSSNSCIVFSSWMRQCSYIKNCNKNK